MAMAEIRIEVDNGVREKAQELFADLGLDLSTAINLFLEQSIRKNCIPWELPNADTIAAMEEAEEMRKHPKRYKAYDDLDEMMRDLLS